MPVEIESKKMDGPGSAIYQRFHGPDYYLEGVAYTLDGTVAVFSLSARDDRRGFTHLEMSRNGQFFEQKFDCAYSQRDLLGVAVDFACEVKRRVP